MTQTPDGSRGEMGLGCRGRRGYNEVPAKGVMRWAGSDAHQG